MIVMQTSYKVIYQELKRQIEDGAYGYGTLLPSQAQLVERHGVAHNTARKALALLASEGYCQPIHGKGVRVIWRPTSGPEPFVVGGLETFAEGAARNATAVVTRVVTFERVIADERLAMRTGFATGDELLRVERVRLLDGRARMRDESHFLAASVRGLTRAQAERSIYAYVEETLGERVAMARRTVTVERATASDARLLDLGDANYLAVLRSQVFDGDGMMFEHAESRRHPSCFCLHDAVTRTR